MWSTMTDSTPDISEERYLELLAQACSGQQASTTEIINARTGPETIRHLMEDASTRASHFATECLRTSPPAKPLACGKGCEHCCWSTVGVMATEAIHLAEQLRAALPEGEFAELREKA